MIGAPRVTADTLELGAYLGVVVDFSVEDDLHRSVFVRHGLRSRRRKVDDAEAAVTEAYAAVRRNPQTGAIRPTVSEDIAHGGNGGTSDRRAAKRKNTYDPTHWPFSPKNERKSKPL
jgi:hypothetical protein